MFDAYYTVVIHWSDNPTKWHPRGPDCSTAPIGRGAFPSKADADDWATENIRGRTYTIRKTEAMT